MTRLALVALLLLTSCVAPPLRAAQPERPHLFYVGLGMQGETWSENDVVDTAERLERVAPRFQLVPTIFSNRLLQEPDRYAPVDGRAITAAIASIAERAAPGDVVLVYASTHGAPGLLGRGANGEELPPVGIDELRAWLAPLRGHDTILILSACFSGSFIPALAGEHRIVLTAARADRTSFGCQAGAEHTVFGDALLQAFAPDRSLHAIVDRTRAAVKARERALRVDRPSLPQVAVGAAAARLYDAPIF